MRLIKLVPIYILCVLLVFCESEKEIVTESSVSIARFATTPEEINQPTPMPTSTSSRPTPIPTPKSRLNGTVWVSKYYLLEARSFDKKHRYNEAIKSFTKSIETGVLSHHSRAIKNTYYLRGQSYKKSGQYQNAIDDFTTFLNANPETTFNNFVLSEGYFSRGYSYYQLREYQKALDDFNKAIELQPSNERYLRALINNAKDSLAKSQRTSS